VPKTNFPKRFRCMVETHEFLYGSVCLRLDAQKGDSMIHLFLVFIFLLLKPPFLTTKKSIKYNFFTRKSQTNGTNICK
jgi:hypothetical protein